MEHTPEIPTITPEKPGTKPDMPEHPSQTPQQPEKIEVPQEVPAQHAAAVISDAFSF